jgi:uncharacterized protein YpmB
LGIITNGCVHQTRFPRIILKVDVCALSKQHFQHHNRYIVVCGMDQEGLTACVWIGADHIDVRGRECLEECAEQFKREGARAEIVLAPFGIGDDVV